jgi:RHS repeat-associated protein
MSEANQGRRPILSLPKGGGALRSLGEKFSVNPLNGSSSLSVPIAASPGRSGFGPQLGLGYDSSSGNGPFGLGWGLTLPAIVRRTDRGLPRYQDSGDHADTFILSGAEDLVPSLSLQDAAWEQETFQRTLDGRPYGVMRYRPRIEGLFARVERWTRSDNGETHWRTVSKNNLTSLYGKTPYARIADPADESRVFSWLIEESYDDKGNVITYTYKREDLKNVPTDAPYEKNRLAAASGSGNRILKRIHYGNHDPYQRADYHFELVFDYGEHDLDAPTPNEIHSWPCRPDPFSSYRPGFELRAYRLCRRVLVFHRFPELGPEPCLVRSTDFGYPAPDPTLTLLSSITESGYIRNPDGSYQKQSFPPLEFAYTQSKVDESVHEIDPEGLENLPAGLLPRDVHWVDLDGEGVAGALIEAEGGWRYKRNRGGGQLAPAELVASQPNALTQPSALNTGRRHLMNVFGDGRLYLVETADPIAGYFARTAEGTWDRFAPFESAPKLDWLDSNLRFVDVDGDGLPDLLLSHDDGFSWHPALGERGFGPAERALQARDEERGPRLMFAEAEQSIFLVDMNGDGLADIVRIRADAVCYWPNLGYGRFGPKVTMQDAPQLDHVDLFDARRIRLADIDGSGTADLLYLGRKRATFWINQCGNRWSAPRTLDQCPPVDDLAAVAVLDLLGDGSACVVWSSPLPAAAAAPLRYISLMSGERPHLLRSVTNNMGAETRLEYAASTKFYLEDREAGTPWATRLPFPVQVVAQAETRDHIANTRSVTTYRYRHGYYDGQEREFRGFGLVEQQDAEVLSSVVGQGELSELPPVEGDEFHLPPVLSRMWFHTGAYFERGNLEAAYADDYYAGDPQAWDLPAHAIPLGLGAEDERQACRALKGSLLRQEIYVRDGSPQSAHPYLVAQRNYQVQLLQPSQGSVPAVFYACRTEALDYHYDRNPLDPRVGHHLNLDVDQYGNVRRSLAIAYPRRAPAFPEQGQAQVAYTEADFVNKADFETFYRLGVPVALRSYEISGLSPAAGLYSVANLLGTLTVATEIAYEVQPPPAGLHKRLLAHQRSVYYRDDQSGPLPLGELESLALPYESYRLAFTAGLVAQTFGARVDAASLQNEGRYILQDGAWWVPSGRHVFDGTRFYLPVQFISPFGEISVTTYDPHSLLAVQIADPLHNQIHATNDYRTLSPQVVTDPNGNRSATLLDAIGLVGATAAMGKAGGPAEGDTLNDPTSRLEYHLFEWRDKGKPNYVRSLARERHAAPDTPWQEAYTYFDGSGREIMKKVPAEPGFAPGRGPDGTLLHDAAGKLVLVDTTPNRRWIGTGRTVYNNKGKPVKQYEPFFSVTPALEDEADLVQSGVTPLLRYDPLGRLTQTDNPNGSFIRVEFTPWQQTIWDVNDTVLESRWHLDRKALPAGDPEQRADTLTVAHAGTPARVQLDVLGRAFRGEQDNGADGVYVTHTAFDPTGNPLRITDARGNLVFEHVLDLLGRKLYFKSCDAGERWTLENAAGAPIRKWDHPDPAKGQQIRLVYDPLQRHSQVWVRQLDTPAATERLVLLTVYGESHPEADALNLRSRVFLQFDEAGLVLQERYDFKGLLLRNSRRFRADPHADADWSGVINADVLGILAAADAQLAKESFPAQMAYDAVNRATSVTTADTSEIRPSYNASGLLTALDVRLRNAAAATPFVSGVDYNARGQRERIRYGSDTITTYSYDPLTWQLARLASTGPVGPQPLQDLSYTYDPVGNVLEVRDQARQAVFFANAAVAPRAQYEYDAIYRLTRASGREHAWPAGAQPEADDPPLLPLPHANDPQALRNYVETYAYDATGNLKQVGHASGPGSWTRRYASAADSNRLLSTSLPGDPAAGPFSAAYVHDRRGNMIQTPGRLLEWTFNDQLRQVDLGAGSRAYYAYDAAGQRVRKIVERPGAGGEPLITEDTLYLGGVELFRRRNGAGLTDERYTLQVVDDRRRIALAETTTVDAGAPVANPLPEIRYQLDNHLSSAIVETDAAGNVISYDEYYPYGGCAYHSAAGFAAARPKRYRFAGQERDAESGLYCQGLRYYAPWLGRWISPDPQGMIDGPNLFAYVRDNPVRYSDPSGTRSDEDELPGQALDLLKLIGIRSGDDGGGGGGCGLFNWIGEAISGAWEGIKSVAGAIWGGIQAAAGAIWSGIKAAAAAVWSGLKTAAKAVWSALKTAASAVWSALKTAAAATWNAIKIAAAATWNALKVAAAATWSAIKTAASFLWDVTKTVVSFAWRWIIAPSIRTATNAIAGAALGFLIGGPAGAIVGGLVGAGAGALHGWAMAYAGSYDFSTVSGWAMFLLDNTWSLPNSVVGSVFAVFMFALHPIDTTTNAGAGELYFQGSATYDTTLGNVTVGHVVPRHEARHALQARIFGPLLYPLWGLSYAINTFLPYWLLYHNFAGHRPTAGPIKGVGDYFKYGVYPHTWFEEWGYSGAQK